MRLLVLLLVLLSTCAFSKPKEPTKPLATSWMIWDINQHRPISSQNVDEVRSIASVTKLMTAMVTIDTADLSEYVTIQRYKGYTTHIPKVVTSMTRLELLNLAMINSDNLAAHLLATSHKDGFDAFVELMNKKAQAIGMKNTRYVEATGLLAENVSTAVDLSLQIQSAMKYPQIVDASKHAKSEIKVKRKVLTFSNTNPLVGSPRNIIISKTGWIRASGGCLVMAVETSHGLRSVIILGSKSTRTRINDALFIMDKLDAPSPTMVEKVIEPFDTLIYN